MIVHFYNWCCYCQCLFLAHLSHWLMVSHCDSWMFVVGRAWRASSTIAHSTSPPKLLAEFLSSLVGMILFNNCSNGSGPLHILGPTGENRFLRKSCLKPQVLKPWYLVGSIIYWTSTKFVQIMPLGPKLGPPCGSHILHRLNRENMKKSSCGKPQCIELWYLVCSITK